MKPGEIVIQNRDDAARAIREQQQQSQAAQETEPQNVSSEIELLQAEIKRVMASIADLGQRLAEAMAEAR